MKKLAFALLAATCFVAPAAAADRVALIVANASYDSDPLVNPHRDAQLIADSLREAGFDKIIEAKDLKLADFRTKLDQFKAEAATAEVAMVYFAGHGFEVDKKNFLAPVDAAVKALDDIPRTMVSLDSVKGSVQDAKRLKIIVLDACRNNPWSEVWKDVGGLRTGLAGTEVNQRNLVVVYAAGEGQEADDGSGENSPFAQALATRLATPGMEISHLLRNVHDDVLLATKDAQTPAVYASLSSEPFYFIPPPPEAPAGVTVEDEQKSAAELELEFWKALNELNEPDLYQVYLDKVQNREFAGTFKELAQRKIAKAGGLPAEQPIVRPAAVEAAPPPPCTAGAQMDVFWNGKWYPATAKSAANGGCLIGYDGYDARWDETVTADRMRARQAPAPVSADDKAKLDEIRPLVAEAQKAMAAGDQAGSARAFERAARMGAKVAAGQDIAAAAALLSGTSYLAVGAKDPRNRLRAARMFKLASELGNSGGGAAYAYMLRTGYGVARNEVKGRSVLKTFAEQGDAQAMAEYGQMLLAGQGGPQRVGEGKTFIRRAAEAGNSTGMLYHAQNVRRDKGDAEAAAWYRRAAEKGSAKAMLALGRLQLWSKTMPRDAAAGKQWLAKAAEQMEPQAMYELARLYVRDPATQAQGAKLAGIASAFGHPEHRLFYARLLEEGIGLKKNIERAKTEYQVILATGKRYYKRRAQLELRDLNAL